MAYFWWRRGYGGEGSQWLARSLTSGGTVSPEVRAKALIGAGRLMIYACELDKGRVALGEALALARRQEDEALIAESLSHLGLAASFAGQHDEGELLLAEALALTRRLGPEPHTSLLGMVFSEMAIAELRRSDYQAALLHLEDALANFVTVGDQRGSAAARILQAHTLRRMRDVKGAVTMLREAIIEGLRFLDPSLARRRRRHLIPIEHRMPRPASSNAATGSRRSTVREGGSRHHAGKARGRNARPLSCRDGAS